MNKSEFYLKWYSEECGRELNEHGYPPCGFKGKEIETADEWTDYLTTEIDLDDFCKLSERACEILGQTWQVPYVQARNYPDMGDQLDQLFWDIDGGKLGADAKTGAWYTAIKKIKDDNPKN
tara:strand:+ start:1372 stop:1734 length:363 start_codon:yes stop_codon:yes gene_type:complete